MAMKTEHSKYEEGYHNLCSTRRHSATSSFHHDYYHLNTPRLSPRYSWGVVFTGHIHKYLACSVATIRCCTTKKLYLCHITAFLISPTFSFHFCYQCSTLNEECRTCLICRIIDWNLH